MFWGKFQTYCNIFRAKQGNLRASLVVRPYSKPLTRLTQIVEEDVVFYATTNFEVRSGIALFLVF